MKHIDLVPFGADLSGYDVVFTPGEVVSCHDCRCIMDIPLLGLRFGEISSLAEAVNTLPLGDLNQMTIAGDEISRVVFRVLRRSGDSAIAVVSSRPMLAEFAHAWCCRTGSPLSSDFLRLSTDDFPVRLVFESPGSWKPTRLERMPMK